MTLQRPAAVLRFDGRALALDESATVSLSVELTTTGAHDRVHLILGPGSPVLDLAAPTDVTIELGYGGDTVAVFAGTVVRVTHRPWGTDVHAVSATGALDAVRVGRAYVARSIGDIVIDLAGEAGVTTGEIDAGTTLAVFHVDEARTAWRHVRCLASLSGAELSSGPRGEMNLRPQRTGTADHTVRGGADLLGWALGPRAPQPERATVGAFSAASEQGSDAWSLVHHDPGGGGFHRIDPSLRDRDIGRLVESAGSSARR